MEEQTTSDQAKMLDRIPAACRFTFNHPSPSTMYTGRSRHTDDVRSLQPKARSHT